MRKTSLRTLDVGCGASPKGDVNVDLLLPGDDSWRTVNPRFIPNLIKADAHHLPIKSGSFDIVYCHHLLEHLQNPGIAVKEIVRVSKRKVELGVPTRQFGSFMSLFPYRREWCRKHHRRLYSKETFLSFLVHETGLDGWRVHYKYIDFLRMFVDRSRPYYDVVVPFPVPYEVRAEIRLNREDSR